MNNQPAKEPKLRSKATGLSKKIHSYFQHFFQIL